MPFEDGNAWEDCSLFANGSKTGWFVGAGTPGSPIVADPDSLRNIEGVEVKWMHHPAGFVSGDKPPSTGVTLSILVRGKLRYQFRAVGTEAWDTAYLEKEGDYFIWHEGMEHRYFAEDYSVAVTVRQPPAG